MSVNLSFVFGIIFELIEIGSYKAALEPLMKGSSWVVTVPF